MSKQGRKRLEEYGSKETGKWLFLQNMPTKLKKYEIQEELFFLLWNREQQGLVFNW